jgi:hypothetical protein
MSRIRGIWSGRYKRETAILTNRRAPCGLETSFFPTTHVMHADMHGSRACMGGFHGETISFLFFLDTLAIAAAVSSSSRSRSKPGTQAGQSRPFVPHELVQGHADPHGGFAGDRLDSGQGWASTRPPLNRPLAATSHGWSAMHPRAGRCTVRCRPCCSVHRYRWRCGWPAKDRNDNS